MTAQLSAAPGQADTLPVLCAAYVRAGDHASADLSERWRRFLEASHPV